MRVLLAAALIALAPGASAAQNVPVTTLARPDAEFPEGFTNISTMRELPDGRVIVLERCERLLKLLDLRTGEMAPVSRTGSGPGEYRLPAGMFSIGDSTVLYDPGNRHFLIFGPDAKPVRTFDPIPSVSVNTGSMVFSTGGFNVTASDARGRLYARQSGVFAGPSGRERAESVAVERWDFRAGKRDTMVFFGLLGKPGPISMTESSPPFLTGTQWAVALDGTVALVHPQDYRVEFISPAKVRTTGKPNAFTPVRVDDAIKQLWRDDQKPPCGPGPTSFTGADGKTITAIRMPTPEPTDWPEVLTPFLTGAVTFAPDGILWVKRTTRAGDPPTFDLINRSGQVAHRVLLQQRARFLGFGRASVYVLRVDDDDLQYVQRFMLPRSR